MYAQKYSMQDMFCCIGITFWIKLNKFVQQQKSDFVLGYL